eukprot:gb/GECH01012269.1/.p1 GENE.gb/GECH01012269.1/~~gb/GECH01012269.1/.p1  ORF type:complete len:176 (+),score=42.25 gb/GECH01012269.1/:1-528(+)
MADPQHSLPMVRVVAQTPYVDSFASYRFGIPDTIHQAIAEAKQAESLALDFTLEYNLLGDNATEAFQQLKIEEEAENQASSKGSKGSGQGDNAQVSSESFESEEQYKLYQNVNEMGFNSNHTFFAVKNYSDQQKVVDFCIKATRLEEMGYDAPAARSALQSHDLDFDKVLEFLST